MKVRPAQSNEGTCDDCVSQECRHYCLLHGESVKNMDIMTCDDYEEEFDCVIHGRCGGTDGECPRC